MNLWFSAVLFTASQIVLAWYCGQLAKTKGYSPQFFTFFGILPIFNIIFLVLLLLLPDKKLDEHQLYMRKFH